MYRIGIPYNIIYRRMYMRLSIVRGETNFSSPPLPFLHKQKNTFHIFKIILIIAIVIWIHIYKKKAFKSLGSAR